MIGLSVGLLHSGWAGAALLLIGAFVGHLYDELYAPPILDAESWRNASDRARVKIEAAFRGLFARHLCRLFVEVARADGEVVQEEIRVARVFFENQLGFTTRELEVVRKALKEAIGSPMSLDTAALHCKEAMEPPTRLLLLDALYALALADGPLKSIEREALFHVASRLEIPEEEHLPVRQRHLGANDDPYALLGVGRAAAEGEVKTAFRKLAHLHHPDRVAHLGPKAVELASTRFREIREAYEAIRAERGW